MVNFLPLFRGEILLYYVTKAKIMATRIFNTVITSERLRTLPHFSLGDFFYIL